MGPCRLRQHATRLRHQISSVYRLPGEPIETPAEGSQQRGTPAEMEMAVTRGDVETLAVAPDDR